MLPNPEERKKLRMEKAAQRKKQQAQQRKLLIRLAIAAGILIACGVLIITLSKPQTPADDAQTPPPSQTPVEDDSAEESPAEPTQEPTTVIHYAAVGDLNVNDATVLSGGSNYVYTETFRDIGHLLADADITSVNFEGTFYGTPYGSASYSAPQSILSALKSAGVDLVQMANSYSVSRGLAGLQASLDAIRAENLEPLGAYPDNASFKQSKGYTIRNVNGVKVAFVAFTKGMNGLALPAGSEDCVNVLYTDYDSAYQDVAVEKITSILSDIEKESPDIVIALLHWGSEFNNTISSSQEEIVELMQANGVDAIIGTHSHYVQKIVHDPETGNFVAYSLGDFFSDASRAGTEYSIILDLEITKDNLTGETKITNYSYTPIFTVHEPDAPLKVVRIAETMAAYENNFIHTISEQTYLEMAYALERITARVAGE